MLLALGMALLAASGNYRSGVETINLPLSPGSGQHVALHCAKPGKSTDKGVLFIHGSSFPTMLAAGFEFKPGDSWMAFMAQQGFLACGLDFLGFGASTRPQAMLGPAAAHPPLLRVPEAAREIGMAIAYMRASRGMREVDLVAHSWGTIPAAAFAANHVGALSSLTLFGPVLSMPGSQPQSEHVAWFGMTAKERLRQLYFSDVLPRGVVLLEPAVTRRWAREFEASAPHISGDPPGEIRIPDGPVADFEEVNAGTYPYSPSRVTAPILMVYGAHDVWANLPNAAAFLGKFTSSPLKWQVCINDGTHVMHLERNRMSLYESVLGFIGATEQLKGNGNVEQ
ncbi:MAG TPA: alpha/beta fold hydrolase [Steroidobacteraceae bacterium]|nr:alpha/beta fold hydrolase [Steroidobacteraceae bacterium]